MPSWSVRTGKSWSDDASFLLRSLVLPDTSVGFHGQHLLADHQSAVAGNQQSTNHHQRHLAAIRFSDGSDAGRLGGEDFSEDQEVGTVHRSAEIDVAVREVRAGRVGLDAKIWKSSELIALSLLKSAGVMLVPNEVYATSSMRISKLRESALPTNGLVQIPNAVDDASASRISCDNGASTGTSSPIANRIVPKAPSFGSYSIENSRASSSKIPSANEPAP